MKNYFLNIKKKLQEKIKIENIEIIDNSGKHMHHKFYSPEKFHLHIKIQSMYLASLNNLSAQRLVMNILKEDLKKKIHALEISIKP